MIKQGRRKEDTHHMRRDHAPRYNNFFIYYLLFYQQAPVPHPSIIKIINKYYISTRKETNEIKIQRRKERAKEIKYQTKIKKYDSKKTFRTFIFNKEYNVPKLFRNEILQRTKWQHQRTTPLGKSYRHRALQVQHQDRRVPPTRKSTLLALLVQKTH